MRSSSSASRSTVSATRALACSSSAGAVMTSLALGELVLRRLHAGRLGEQVQGGEGHGLGRRDHARARQRLHRRVREVAGVDGHAGGGEGHHTRGGGGAWPRGGGRAVPSWVGVRGGGGGSRSGIGAPSVSPAVVMLAAKRS